MQGNLQHLDQSTHFWQWGHALRSFTWRKKIKSFQRTAFFCSVIICPSSKTNTYNAASVCVCPLNLLVCWRGGGRSWCSFSKRGSLVANHENSHTQHMLCHHARVQAVGCKRRPRNIYISEKCKQEKYFKSTPFVYVTLIKRRTFCVKGMRGIKRREGRGVKINRGCSGGGREGICANYKSVDR